MFEVPECVPILTVAGVAVPDTKVDLITDWVWTLLSAITRALPGPAGLLVLLVVTVQPCEASGEIWPKVGVLTGLVRLYQNTCKACLKEKSDLSLRFHINGFKSIKKFSKNPEKIWSIILNIQTSSIVWSEGVLDHGICPFSVSPCSRNRSNKYLSLSPYFLLVPPNW